MDKTALRRDMRLRRAAMSAKERERESALACEQLMQWPLAQRMQVIFSYLAQPEELDLTAFHRWAWEQGKTLAFPVSGSEGRMEAYVPAAPDAFVPGRFGILEPKEPGRRLVTPESLALVLVPCLAVDAGGQRLGQGGGYYDRYLPRCPQAVTAAAAFSCQRRKEVPTEPWDVTVDYVLTGEGIFKIT